MNNESVPTPPRVVSFISKQLWRVNQGLARINVIWALVGFLTFIKVWQGTFEYFGISIGVVFLILGILYFFTSWFVGYLNETKQFSRAEWLHQIQVQNPEYWQLIEDMHYCRNVIEENEKRVKDDGR